MLQSTVSEITLKLSRCEQIEIKDNQIQPLKFDYRKSSSKNVKKWIPAGELGAEELNLNCLMKSQLIVFEVHLLPTD